MQRSRVTLAASVALAACCCALHGCTQDATVAECAPVSAAPAATSAAIESSLAAIKDKYKLNAIIFGAEQDGAPLVRTALGVSTAGVPATTQMHFRVGGVGWQYLVTVLLRMVEQNPGAIALTDRVAKWYPAYPNADRTTVRMLAASSAGFGDYITPPSFVAALMADPLRYWSADDLLARSVLPYQPPQFDDPGHNWQYSHTDFVMLGAILEKVSGRKYSALLQDLVLDPLALRDTRLQLDTAPQLPVLHTLAEGDFEDSTYWESVLRVVGGADVEHLRPGRLDACVRHGIAALAGTQGRAHGAGECRAAHHACRCRPACRPSGRLLRPGHGRVSAVGRAAGRVLGDVHDDRLRHDDGHHAVGDDIAQPRLAA